MPRCRCRGVRAARRHDGWMRVRGCSLAPKGERRGVHRPAALLESVPSEGRDMATKAPRKRRCKASWKQLDLFGNDASDVEARGLENRGGQPPADASRPRTSAPAARRSRRRARPLPVTAPAGADRLSWCTHCGRLVDEIVYQACYAHCAQCTLPLANDTVEGRRAEARGLAQLEIASRDSAMHRSRSRDEGPRESGEPARLDDARSSASIALSIMRRS